MFFNLMSPIRTSKAPSKLQSGRFMIRTVGLIHNCAPAAPASFSRTSEQEESKNPGCGLSCSDAEGL